MPEFNIYGLLSILLFCSFAIVGMLISSIFKAKINAERQVAKRAAKLHLNWVIAQAVLEKWKSKNPQEEPPQYLVLDERSAKLMYDEFVGMNQIAKCEKESQFAA